MLMEKRRKLILEEINIKNIVYVKKLAKKYSVTTETIRKDLEDIILENRDIKKVYGGALKSSSNAIDESYTLRNELFSDEKDILAQKAATLIEDNDCIFLDAGTTVVKLIPYLKNRKNLKIVTVSFSVVIEFFKFFKTFENSHKIFFIGGEVKLNLLSTSGTKAVFSIKDYLFNKAFLTLDGLSLEKGITSHDCDEAFVTSEVLKNSIQNIFLVTNDKLNTSKFYKVCDLDSVNSIVSLNPENDFLKKISKNFNINLY